MFWLVCLLVSSYWKSFLRARYWSLESSWMAVEFCKHIAHNIAYYDDINLSSTWRMASSGMLCHVALVRNDVSEELSASIIRVTRIGELGTTLAVQYIRLQIWMGGAGSHGLDMDCINSSSDYYVSLCMPARGTTHHQKIMSNAEQSHFWWQTAEMNPASCSCCCFIGSKIQQLYCPSCTTLLHSHEQI
jgi:hypothetical protein